METAITANRRADAFEASRREAQSSGMSWGAVLGGAFVAAALALILLLLGTGLGLTAVSPWSNDGLAAKTLGIAAITWMIITHFASSAVGGYMAGRLRTKWVDVQTDEMFFRDTAHGLVAWAFGIVLTAAFLTSAVTTVVGGAANLGATSVAATAGGAAAGAATQSKEAGVNSNAYFVDSLFRSDRPRSADDSSVREEAGSILVSGLRQGDVPAADKSYLAQLVAKRTGLSQAEAEKRVTDAIGQAKEAEAKARQAADTARKAAVRMALWTCLALLIGAFVAAYAATIGGRHRDSL
jgi:hypothetical protein